MESCMSPQSMVSKCFGRASQKANSDAGSIDRGHEDVEEISICLLCNFALNKPYCYRTSRHDDGGLCNSKL
jgi:hypothetical protein